MNSERKLNLERICRTCMKEKEDMQNLFESSQKLKKLLLYCSNLQICENDGLPAQICLLCVNLAKNAEMFKKQCENSERQLREYINMGLQKVSPQMLQIKNEEQKFTADLYSVDKAVKYECLWCIEKFNHNYDFNLHLGTHTEKSDHKCHICECYFVTSSSLVEHVDVHKTNAKISAIKTEYSDDPGTCESNMLDPIKCILDSECDLKSGESEDENANQSTKKPVDLKVCFRKMSKLKMLRPSLEKKFQCKICNRNFKRKLELGEHLQIEHKMDLQDNEKFRKCPHCDKILHSHLSWRKHILEVHCSEILKCTHCPSTKKYYSSYYFKRHQTSHQDLCLNANSGMYECKICIEQFIDYDLLSKHMGNHVENSTNVCHLCDCYFRSNTNLQHHIKHHKKADDVQIKSEFVLADGDAEKKMVGISCNVSPNDIECSSIKCSNANFLSDNDSLDDEYLPVAKLKEEAKNLTKDEEDGIAKSYVNVCSHCNQSFKREIWLHKHMYQAHNILPAGLKKENLEKQQLKCPECDKFFHKNVFLKTHMLRIHNLTKFKCVDCSKTFQKYVYLVEHQKRHAGGKSYLCSECGQGFFKQNELTRHLVTHGKDKGERPSYICPVCGRVLHFLNHLQVHMRCHRNRMPDNPAPDPKQRILCATCGASCSSRSNLAVHMRRHDGTVTCRCKLCGKGYPRTTDLILHMRKHTGERPFVCQVCNKGFARSDKLSIHMRIHTGERPYVCQNCGRAYIQSNDLALHRKRNNCIRLSKTKSIPTEALPPNENIEIAMNVTDATLATAENENTEIDNSLPNITVAVATGSSLNTTNIDTRNLITVMEETISVSDFMKQNILVPNLLANGTNSIGPLELAAGNTGILQQKVDFSDYAASLLSVQSFAHFNPR